MPSTRAGTGGHRWAVSGLPEEVAPAAPAELPRTGPSIQVLLVGLFLVVLGAGTPRLGGRRFASVRGALSRS